MRNFKRETVPCGTKSGWIGGWSQRARPTTRCILNEPAKHCQGHFCTVTVGAALKYSDDDVTTSLSLFFVLRPLSVRARVRSSCEGDTLQVRRKKCQDDPGKKDRSPRSGWTRHALRPWTSQGTLRQPSDRPC